MARLAGLEPTASSSAGMRSIQAELQAPSPVRTSVTFLVPRVGFEPTRPYGHYALNVARLPFRHLGSKLPTGVPVEDAAAPQRVRVRSTGRLTYGGR